MKIAVIIPCYNEEASIAAVIDEVNAVSKTLSHQLDVVVVNDASTDNTVNVVLIKNATCLQLPVNLGIGGAVQCGFKYAYENNYDIAIQLDGDGQHPANEIPKLIEAILNNEADVVVGSRFLTKEGFQSTYIRRVGINYFMWLNKMLIGKKIHDSTSGFRAINKKTLEIVSKYYPDEYPEPEAIVLYSLNNLRIAEVPVTMRERQGGVSSIRSGVSVYYMFKVTLAILFIYLRLKSNKK